MRVYVRKPLFYFILVLIALLPLSKKAGLLLSGTRTTGTVIDYGIIDDNKSYKYRGHYDVSIISFIAGGKEYHISGPLNVVYDLGEEVTVIYDKDNPADYTLLTISSLYSGTGLIMALFVLMVWMAFYLTWGAKELPKKKRGSGYEQKRLD